VAAAVGMSPAAMFDLQAAGLPLQKPYSLALKRKLVDRHVIVVVFKRLAIFRDLDSVAIKDAHGNMLTAKLYSTISRRNPTLDSRIPFFIVHRDFNVGSFKRPNSDTVRSG
jgi:hypothetical protein